MTRPAAMLSIKSETTSRTSTPPERNIFRTAAAHVAKETTR